MSPQARVHRASLHPAVLGFERGARSYDRGRPGYPKVAVDCVRKTLRLGPGQVVVELGAGTGKFTQYLVSGGSTLIPVEPLVAMRRRFRHRLPGVPILEGTAEAIPLPDRIADAVVSAQAFHWFRQPAALNEIARVLRPGGRLLFLWNVRSEKGWLQGYSRIVRRYQRSYPKYRSGRWRGAFRRVRSFGPLHERHFRWRYRSSPAQLRNQILSVSYVALQSPKERRRVARELNTLLASAPETRNRQSFFLPYSVDLFWCVRRRGHTPSRR